jgi:hypothetical protein
MKQGLYALSLATALAFAAGALVPAVARPLDQGVTRVATKKHHARRPAPREAGYVACTFLGCVRIPANCRPVTDYYADGTPTGYDAVACPNAKYYSRS